MGISFMEMVVRICDTSWHGRRGFLLDFSGLVIIACVNFEMRFYGEEVR